jgi:hypothetical protein
VLVVEVKVWVRMRVSKEEMEVLAQGNGKGKKVQVQKVEVVVAMMLVLAAVVVGRGEVMEAVGLWLQTFLLLFRSMYMTIWKRSRNVFWEKKCSRKRN